MAAETSKSQRGTFETFNPVYFRLLPEVAKNRKPLKIKDLRYFF
jgi:hypothetical protein